MERDERSDNEDCDGSTYEISESDCNESESESESASEMEQPSTLSSKIPRKVSFFKQIYVILSWDVKKHIFQHSFKSELLIVAFFVLEKVITIR